MERLLFYCPNNFVVNHMQIAPVGPLAPHIFLQPCRILMQVKIGITYQKEKIECSVLMYYWDLSAYICILPWNTVAHALFLLVVDLGSLWTGETHSNA